MTSMPVYVEPVGFTSFSEDLIGKTLEEILQANPDTQFPLCYGRYELLTVIEKDEKGDPCFVLLPADIDEDGRRDIILAPCRSHRVSPVTADLSKVTSVVVPLESYSDYLTVKVIAALFAQGVSKEEVAARLGISVASVYRKRKKCSLPENTFGDVLIPDTVHDLRSFIQLCEKKYIQDAIKKLGNREMAASCLGISIATLYRKLR